MITRLPNTCQDRSNFLSFFLPVYNPSINVLRHTNSMFALLIITLFGIFFAMFATQNTGDVPVHILGYWSGSIPLYLVSLLSLFTGIVISWILSLFGWAATFFTLHSKDAYIRKTDGKIDSLQRKIHELEIENERLRGEKHEVEQEAKDKIEEVKLRNTRPNIVDKLRTAI